MIQSLKRQTAIIILHTGDSKTLVGASTRNVAYLAAGPASWRGTGSSTPTTTPPTDSRRGSRPTSERIFKSICFLTRFLDRFCHFRFLFGRYQLKIACKLPSVSKGRHWRRTIPKRLALASPFSLAMST